MDYHQRLKECNLYSMEQRRERFIIIYAWQMLEGIKTYVLGLGMKVSKRIGNRRIQLGDIKKVQKGWYKNAGKYTYKNNKQSRKKDGKAVHLHTKTSERYYKKSYKIFQEAVG